MVSDKQHPDLGTWGGGCSQASARWPLDRSPVSTTQHRSPRTSSGDRRTEHTSGPAGCCGGKKPAGQGAGRFAWCPRYWLCTAGHSWHCSSPPQHSSGGSKSPNLRSSSKLSSGAHVSYSHVGSGTGNSSHDIASISNYSFKPTAISCSSMALSLL